METRVPLLGEPVPVELMNTIRADRDGVHDALGDPAGTRRGCARSRPALRGLAAAATGDPRPAAVSAVTELQNAVTAVNEAAGLAPSWPTLAWAPGREPRRLLRSTDQGAQTAISVIAEQEIALFSQEDRLGLRASMAPGCVLHFLNEHPRREWCSAACGNRAGVARHYEHHRNTPA